VIGRKTGATWEDAFNTISEALAFSKVYNDTIKNANKKIKFVYVKEGEYKENFEMVDGVSVLGGYKQSLIKKEIDRDYTIKPTIEGKGLPAPLISFGAEITTNTRLECFIIQNATNPSSKGGALSMNSDSAIVQSCLIQNNSAEYGGAAYILRGQILSSVFTNNAAQDGSSVYAENPAYRLSSAGKASIKNCTFVNNNGGPSTVSANAHPDAILINSIIVGGANSTPQGWTYNNCAFTIEELMPWEDIERGNVRICSQSALHIYPYADKVTDAGFKSGSEIYELNNTSKLIGRGYLPAKDFVIDFNGNSPKDPMFPDLGAIQTGIYKAFLDLYIKETNAPMFVPAAKDYVNYIVFSNSVVSIFSSELIYPNTKPYQKSVILARF
ncbi:MAG: hypothetical protein ACRC9Q_07715, partial [Bacteroidales bacterium]